MGMLHPTATRVLSNTHDGTANGNHNDQSTELDQFYLYTNGCDHSIVVTSSANFWNTNRCFIS